MNNNNNNENPETEIEGEITISQEDINATSSSSPSSNTSPITPEEDAAFTEEIEKEKEFGDSPIRTGLESAASSATFGISDQLLVKTGISSKEELRERRIRNKNADIAGEIAGVVVPALLTGGTSAAAKGAAAGVTAAAKTGLKAEALTASFLKKVLKEQGKSSLAKEVLRKSIAKGAGSAVEGTFYGVGELISEEALGNASFNAENLIASAGAGAVLGGLAGGALGTVEALVPVIKNGAVVSFKNKSFSNILDPELNAMQLAGLSPTQIAKRKSRNPTMVSHTPEMLKEVASKKNLGAFSSNKKLFKSVNEFIEETGEGIGKTLEEVTSSLEHKSLLPTKSTLATKVNERLNTLASKFKDSNGKVLKGASDQLKKIEKVIAEFDEDLISDVALTATDLNALKGKYQKLAKWDRKGNLAISEEVNREVSRAIREQVMDIAEQAGGSLGLKLQKQLKDYGSAQEFSDAFGLKIDKQSTADFLNFKDAILSSVLVGSGADVLSAGILAKRIAQTDFKRRLTILTSIEKANQKINSQVSKGVASFIKGKKVAKPLTYKALTTSGLAYDLSKDSPTKPKTPQEGFKNLQKNLLDLADPEKAPDFFRRGNIQDAAPQTHLASQAVLASAASFLQQKLPTSYASQGALSNLLNKPHTPSTIEMSKFQRYLEAVENPLSVINNLKEGKVSRESIEAIQAVYPKLYEKIQMEVMEKIQTSPESITYPKRLQLGILLSIPTDAALVPSNIEALQSHYKESEQSQTGGALSPTAASKLDMAESTATEVQKVSNRSDLN